MEKFDLLFHRSGPLAGQPRGYAFVTYSTSEEAQHMKDALDGKKIGNKIIAVRWAHNLTMEDRDKPKVELQIPALTGAKEEQKTSRTTKIQAIEAKLKMMEKSSNSEFQLADGPSVIIGRLHQSTTKEKVGPTKIYTKTKPYSKFHHRR